MLRKLFPSRKKNTAGFAYLFEKFPSFSQTFCAREVAALRQSPLDFPVFSIRRPTDEPSQDFSAGVGEVTYLPDKYDTLLAEDAHFRRAARKWVETLKEVWGSDEQKRRIYEALWLGPRLQDAGVEHVHVHFVGLAARTAFWLRRIFGIRYSVTAHANDIFCDESPARLRQIFEEAALVITVSYYSLRFLQENYPSSRAKFFRVYNGVDTESFAQSTLPPRRPLIVSIGRYIEKKGFSYLIDACAQLPDLDFECLIIGHGPLDESLKVQVIERGLESKVRITGPRSETEIRELLAQAHLFVLPCVTGANGELDNLPTVIMEAMAAGVPSISTSLAAVPEMIIDGETGYVVPERDSTALADKMRLVLADSNGARAMGQAGLQRGRALFDIRVTSESLIQLFRQHDALR